MTKLFAKIYKVRKVITVEPLIGLYQFAISLPKPALENLELEKACRVNLNYNDTICDTILEGHHKNYSSENNNIQILISQTHSWQLSIQGIIPLLLIIFLGSYSDRHKWRRPFFIIPLLGDFLGNMGNLLCVINMKTWTLDIQAILSKVLPSFFGTLPLFAMSTTSYVADISTKENRTLQLGVITLVITVSVVIAQSLSGILFKTAGYYGVLLISSAVFIIALLYGIFCIPIEHSVLKRRCLLSDIFNPIDAINTFKVLCKKTPMKIYLHLLLIFALIHGSTAKGEDSIVFLYVQKVFQWTPVDMSYFNTIFNVVNFFGSILGLWLFVKVLQLHDLVLLFITLFTRALTGIIFGCAKTSIVFYTGIIISLLTRLTRVATRSYISKIVSQNDIGKTVSLLGIVEAIAPILGVPLYSIIYQNTLQIFPATIFFCTILAYFICCCVVALMYFKAKSIKKKGISTENAIDVFQTTHI